MVVKYCPNCKRNVNTEHGYNTVALVILLIFFFIPGIIYWAVTRKQRCPICHTQAEMLTEPKPDDNSGAFDKSSPESP